MGEMMIMTVMKVILMKIMREKLPIPAYMLVLVIIYINNIYKYINIYTCPQPYSCPMCTCVQRTKAAKTTQISSAVVSRNFTPKFSIECPFFRKQQFGMKVNW